MRERFGGVVMIAGKQSRVVLVTCGSITEARRIAHHVVGKRLAACANIVLGPIESIYRWKGEVHSAREVLIVIKTSTKRLADLEREVLRLHSYDVPEFIVLAISAGSREYLAWVNESISA
jgi:periplasmic divalent cation tolerance protein